MWVVNKWIFDDIANELKIYELQCVSLNKIYTMKIIIATKCDNDTNTFQLYGESVIVTPIQTIEIVSYWQMSYKYLNCDVCH
jgi:hypothetical protein